MISISAYRKLFPKDSGVIGYVQMPGNVGDLMIEFATLNLMRRWNIPHEIVPRNRLSRRALPKHISRLYIGGGGNMGNLYQDNKDIRNAALSTGKPVIVLPQSFTNANENTDRFEKVWVRERDSLKICPQAGLAPDMAMSLKLDSRSSDVSRKTGVFLREDIEALFSGHPASHGDPILLGSNLAEYFELAAPFEHIVTDRLHFAITGLLMKRAVTLLPNGYFKNRSMWETWFANKGCLWADHPDEIDGIRSRRSRKFIAKYESFPVKSGDSVKTTKSWHNQGGTLFCDGESVEQIKTDKPPHRMFGHVGNVIWNLCLSGASTAELKKELLQLKRISRQNVDAELNRHLRRFFDLGAIEWFPGRPSFGMSPTEFLGGSRGVPIEVTVSSPVRIGSDQYQFADIRQNGQRKTVWFRANLSQKIKFENAATCFLLAVLHIAMEENAPIWIRGGAIDREVLANLDQYQYIWTLWHKEKNRIPIYAETLDGNRELRPKPSRSVCCYSGGVDSTFSLFNHTSNPANDHKSSLTDAVLVHGLDIPINNQAAFDNVEMTCGKITAELGLNLISTATNIRSLNMDWGSAHGAVLAGAMHLIAGDFTHGLIPSTLNYGILYPWGSTPLTDQMLSSSTFRIMSDGADHTRMDKLISLRNWKQGAKSLRFCWKAYPEDHNCGRCQKCTITAVMLILAGLPRDSIKPFPSHKRLTNQLQAFPVSRLDKSDFRNEIDALRGKDRPQWIPVLIEKFDSL
ncbi:MAG: polysaccharide pyruvyl transferase family protein [Pseudomonadota bacterium]